METLIKADIFFFITSISIVFITIILAWGLIYVIRILRNVKDISDEAVVETKKVVEDIDNLRHDLKREGSGLMDKVKFFSRFITPKKKRSTHAKKKSHKSE